MPTLICTLFVFDIHSTPSNFPKLLVQSIGAPTSDPTHCPAHRLKHWTGSNSQPDPARWQPSETTLWRFGPAAASHSGRTRGTTRERRSRIIKERTRERRKEEPPAGRPPARPSADSLVVGGAWTATCLMKSIWARVGRFYPFEVSVPE